MPLDPHDVEEARCRQHGAAQDPSDTVRLVAGPGTGKSASIEERFRWLCHSGVNPRHVYGVSFTRAASKDLHLRASRYCAANGVAVAPEEIRVSTLHSLALTTLARANQLAAYPVRPLVLDEWEVEHIFDAEFVASTHYSAGRAEDIRKEHEAFWSTGDWNPANYIQPDPPITEEERQAFADFHGPTTQTYACVLPGEIIRLCVQQIQAGLLDAAQELEMEHLIVDEYQDLNPLDIEFVDLLASEGVSVFVAGDDDQSIYSFRFASPAGIQEFTDRHPGAGDHILEDCFRSAARIVASANALIGHFSPPSRIPKTLRSLWATATPAVHGVVHRWRCAQNREAEVIADSCAGMIAAGIAPAEIMLLLSNSRGLFPDIRRAFDDTGVPYVPPKEDSWIDTEAGRFILGVLRIVCNPEQDYVAHRLVLGCRHRVGPTVCHQIVERAVLSNLNYRDLFYLPLPAGIFNARQTGALNAARAVCGTLGAWTSQDDLGLRRDDLRNLLAAARPAGDLDDWDEMAAALPDGMNLEELRDYLWADNSDQQHTILTAVHQRLELEPPEQTPAPGVRVMTMHGAKGLQANIVFIPGLEEYILPGPRRASAPGLVMEGARLLYVSITRARAAVILSYANGRYFAGQWRTHSPSRYCAHLAGRFVWRTDGLTAAETTAIVDAINDIQTAARPDQHGESDAGARA